MEKPDCLFHTPTTHEQMGCPCGVALGIEREEGKCQFHCGLAFKMSPDEIRILHLMTHNALRCDDDWRHFQCIIQTNVNPMRLRSFTHLCNMICNRMVGGNSRVTYGLRFDDYESEYDEEGILHLGEHKIGLTCATYVLTLFHSIGIDLIKLEDWPDREDDWEWQDDIVGTMKQYKTHPVVDMDKEHLAKLKEEAASHPHRYRPEEVAASSYLYKGATAMSEDIIALGADINQYMQEVY